MPGTNDAYEASSTTTSIDIPGTLRISPQVTLTPTGPLVAGVAFPNVKGEADQAGQVDTNYTGTLTLRVAGLNVAYSKSYTQTAIAGKASFAVTPMTQAGTYRFYLSLPGSGEIHVLNSDVLVVAAAASQVVISTPFISPAARGVSGVVGFAAEDVYGNTVTNFTGTVTVTTSDAGGVDQACEPHVHYQRCGLCIVCGDLQLSTGTQSITASATGLTSGTQNGIVGDCPAAYDDDNARLRRLLRSRPRRRLR